MRRNRGRRRPDQLAKRSSLGTPPVATVPPTTPTQSAGTGLTPAEREFIHALARIYVRRLIASRVE